MTTYSARSSAEAVGERVLVTTLTKKCRRTDRLPARVGREGAVPALEIDTLERIQIIRELRLGEYDVLVGVNCSARDSTARVSLVAILDATRRLPPRPHSLIQTIGRAAPHHGRVLMYATSRPRRSRTTRETIAARDPVVHEGTTSALSITKGVSDIAEFLSLESPTCVAATPRREEVEGLSREELESSS